MTVEFKAQIKIWYCLLSVQDKYLSFIFFLYLSCNISQCIIFFCLYFGRHCSNFLRFSYIFMLHILKTKINKNIVNRCFLLFYTCLHCTRDIDQSLSKNFHSYYKDTYLCQPNLNNLSFLNKIFKKIQQNLLDWICLKKY